MTFDERRIATSLIKALCKIARKNQRAAEKHDIYQTRYQNPNHESVHTVIYKTAKSSNERAMFSRNYELFVVLESGAAANGPEIVKKNLCYGEITESEVT